MTEKLSPERGLQPASSSKRAEARAPIQAADSTDAAPVCARAVLTAPESEVGEIMFMPAGEHTINATRSGRPITASVNVTRHSADLLQQQLVAIKARSAHRPFFDFDHEDREASGWPVEFAWREQPAPGVYCRVEWSQAGSDAIKGKSYRAFSPVFYIDKSTPAKIICREDADLNFGGLVNDPAFKQILPLWAKHAGASSDATPQKHNMTPEQIAALQAKQTQLEQDIAALKAKSATVETLEAIKAKESEAALAREKIVSAEKDAKIINLEASIKAGREKEADDAIKAAITRGAIGAKEEAVQAHWKKLIVQDPANVVLLAAQAGSPALGGGRIAARGVNISREDSTTVLNAFVAEKDPRKRAAIYAKEIKPRLAEGDDMPLQGANSIGTLAGTLVTQRTLELLKLTFPVLTRIATDFSDQPANYNQTISTRIVSIPTVQTYNASTGWAASDDTTTDVNVTINQHKGVPLVFDANALASTVRRLFDEAAPAAAYALAKNMVDYVYGLILAASFTNSNSQALANFGRPDVIDMGVQLNLRGVPMGAMNRTLLLYSTYFGTLAKDSAIVTLASFQKSEIITDGSLPNVHGFTVVDAPNLPATGNMVGFGFSKSALVLATRLPNDYSSVLPGASYGNVSTVTDPDLGISVMQVQYVNHDLGTATQRIALMYGAAVGQANAGQLLVSA